MHWHVKLTVPALGPASRYLDLVLTSCGLPSLRLRSAIMRFSIVLFLSAIACAAGELVAREAQPALAVDPTWFNRMRVARKEARRAHARRAASPLPRRLFKIQVPKLCRSVSPDALVRYRRPMGPVVRIRCGGALLLRG